MFFKALTKYSFAVCLYCLSPDQLCYHKFCVKTHFLAFKSMQSVAKYSSSNHLVSGHFCICSLQILGWLFPKDKKKTEENRDREVFRYVIRIKLLKLKFDELKVSKLLLRSFDLMVQTCFLPQLNGDIAKFSKKPGSFTKHFISALGSQLIDEQYCPKLLSHFKVCTIFK